MAPLRSELDPSTLVAYSHAAAGHDGVQSDPTGEMLIKPCTAAEVAFYESAAAHPDFKAFMPTFMGTLSLSKNDETSTAAVAAPEAAPEENKSAAGAGDWVPSGGKKLETGLSIVLENVAKGFKKPNVIDLKLGAQLWDDEAPETKRRKLDEVSDATTSRSLGFRIAGMQVYRPPPPLGSAQPRQHVEVTDKGYMVYDKFYGREFDAGNVHEAFMDYFGAASEKSQAIKTVMKGLARGVKDLVTVMETQESRMYSASILMVYEGDQAALDLALEQEKQRGKQAAESASSSAGSKLGKKVDAEEDRTDGDGDEDEDEDENRLRSYDMRLIDFAHAAWTPGLGPDENALHGLRSVLKVFDRISGSSV
jgi:inositol-polyphosphate multikinase